MIEKLSTALAKEGKHANLSPEVLEMMGKSAANTFIEKGVSLNESISKLAAAHNDISQEQVKRVCEFANTAVYLAKHDMSKTAGSKESYPEFDLADPNRVIQDLSDGTKSTITTKVDADYSKLPAKMKTSSAKSKADLALEELFSSKTAEDLDYSKQTAIDEVMAAKEQLKGLQDHLSSAGEQFDMTLKEASAEFYELSKRHMMSNGSFADIAKVAASTGASAQEAHDILAPVIKLLVQEKVASAKELTTQMKGLEKVAHRTINPDHPMLKAASAIVESNREIEKIAHGLLETEKGLKQVNSFIKEKLSAGTAH
jgi:hypothetical protein